MCEFLSTNFTGAMGTVEAELIPLCVEKLVAEEKHQLKVSYITTK